SRRRRSAADPWGSHPGSRGSRASSPPPITPGRQRERSPRRSRSPRQPPSPTSPTPTCTRTARRVPSQPSTTGCAMPTSTGRGRRGSDLSANPRSHLLGAPMAKTTICLSFDFDAISVWMGSFGAATPTAMSRGEFAADVATPRILDLLEREGVPSTWFIPGLDADTFPDSCKRVRDSGHDIGHHGYCHESPVGLDEKQERDVLERGLAALDRVLGVVPRGYRSPAFDLSPQSVRLLRECGFEYDSSMMGRDFELYRCREGDVMHRDRAPEWGAESDLVEVPVSWTLDDFPFMELVVAPPIVFPASTDVAAMGRRWVDD